MDTPAIQSASNEVFKRFKRLAAEASARRKEGLFWVEGEKLCLEALHSKLTPREAILAADYEGPMLAELKKKRLQSTLLAARLFRSAADTETPQGVALLMEMPKALAPLAPRLSVALERVQDPGNLGTILRSALAAGCEAVFLGEGCADAWSPKSVRAAGGSQCWLTIEERLNIRSKIEALKAQGCQVVALEPEAKQGLWDTRLPEKLCLLVGSEGQGLNGELLKACNQTIKLDYPGHVESLNAGVSLSIALFEALRQRRK